jgi:hypothetical protein
MCPLNLLSLYVEPKTFNNSTSSKSLPATSVSIKTELLQPEETVFPTYAPFANCHRSVAARVCTEPKLELGANSMWYRNYTCLNEMRIWQVALGGKGACDDGGQSARVV